MLKQTPKFFISLLLALAKVANLFEGTRFNTGAPREASPRSSEEQRPDARVWRNSSVSEGLIVHKVIKNSITNLTRQSVEQDR